MSKTASVVLSFLDRKWATCVFERSCQNLPFSNALKCSQREIEKEQEI